VRGCIAAFISFYYLGFDHAEAVPTRVNEVKEMKAAMHPRTPKNMALSNCGNYIKVWKYWPDRRLTRG
jgi:hypothetical protein